MKANFVLNKIKIASALVGLSVAVPAVRAQGIITINPSFFHADSSKNIILINAPLSQLNAAVAGGDSIKTLVVGGHRYTLARAVARFNTAASYQATANARTYAVYVTRVPVLHLTTRHQIADAPSVYAKLVLADSTGVLAQSATGIEFRGAFSQSYPKKSYELSLWADTLGAADRDLSLLGMRSDNKWNLQAMYNDQLRVRLKVANELWQDIDQVYYKAQEPNAQNGIDLAYTEMFLNDSYQGIYTLTERIDKKQLKLKKYANNTIAGELYKGTYLTDASEFTGAPPFDNTSLTWSGFEYKEPSEQTNWGNLYNLVNFVVNSSATDFYSQYKSRLNLANVVDYYILLNLLRATDNTGKNVYIARYKANEPYYYAPWDLDGVLGNDWMGRNVNTTNDLLSNGLYDRLMQDYSATGFRAALASRWSSLRTSVITNAYITNKIKVNHDYLLTNNVYKREQAAWPNYHYDAAQLAYPTDWLTNRLTYLDKVFKLTGFTLSAADAQAATTLQLYPNPASDYLNVELKAGPAQLLIQDVSGHTMLQTSLAAGASRLSISSLPKGLYVATIKSAAATTVQKLLLQ
jgi:hypothetical protein